MGARGEELGDAGRVEAALGEAEGGAQAGATGTDDDGIVPGRGMSARRPRSRGTPRVLAVCSPERATQDDATAAAAAATLTRAR